MQNIDKPESMFKNSDKQEANRPTTEPAPSASLTSVAVASKEKSTAASGNETGGMESNNQQKAPEPTEAASTDSSTSLSVASKKESALGQQSDEPVDMELLFKHPLQNTWTLWHLEINFSKSWADMQSEVASFDTVEDFWSLINHIKPPSEIESGEDYSVFKKGIRPFWEDAANKQGGRWLITLDKGDKNNMDNMWLNVLFCLIGETLEHSDQICGAVAHRRSKNQRISIWTANAKNEEATLKIGHNLRNTLGLEQEHSLQYQLHHDTMVKYGSNAKTIYTL